jgi:hypothetical protein
LKLKEWRWFVADVNWRGVDGLGRWFTVVVSSSKPRELENSSGFPTYNNDGTISIYILYILKSTKDCC